MPKPPFKTLFCEHFKCPPSDYEKRAFRKCLYSHAKLIAPFIRLLSPTFFEEDIKFLQYLGAATGVREANADALSFQDTNRGKPSMLRTGLRIRVSGRKASKLAVDLFVHSQRQSVAASKEGTSVDS